MKYDDVMTHAAMLMPIVLIFFAQSYLHLQRIKVISKNYDMRIAEIRSLQNSMRNHIANLRGSMDALSLDVASLAREIELRRAEEQPQGVAAPRLVRRPIRLS